MPAEEEGLLVKTDRGTYRWGKYRGYTDNFHCCLLARVTEKPIVSPAHEAWEYGLKREMTQPEIHAIAAADHGDANDQDRELIVGLAHEIGVKV